MGHGKAWCAGEVASALETSRKPADSGGEFEAVTDLQRTSIVTVFALIAAVATTLGAPCGSFHDAEGRTAVDLAPPSGFLDACSRDSAACDLLKKSMQGRPILGLFVTEEEWERYRKKEIVGFSRYFVAQRLEDMTTAEMDRMKSYIRAKQGKLPDASHPPKEFEVQDQVSLGVLDETADSISFGGLVRLKTEDPRARSFAMASVNTVLQVRGESLSLYATLKVEKPDIAELRAFSKQWLSCLRDANKVVKR